MIGNINFARRSFRASCLLFVLVAIITLYDIQGARAGEQETFTTEEMSQDYYRNEINRIGRLSPKPSAYFYFIKIADGYIPIPNRYVIYPDAKKYGESRLVNLFSGGKGSKWFAKGFMAIGDYHEYVKHESARYAKRFDSERRRYGKLNVVIMTDRLSKDSEFGPIILALFHDDKRYVLVGDENPELWKAMVKAYEKSTVDRVHSEKRDGKIEGKGDRFNLAKPRR